MNKVTQVVSSTIVYMSSYVFSICPALFLTCVQVFFLLVSIFFLTFVKFNFLHVSSTLKRNNVLWTNEVRYVNKWTRFDTSWKTVCVVGAKQDLHFTIDQSSYSVGLIAEIVTLCPYHGGNFILTLTTEAFHFDHTIKAISLWPYHHGDFTLALPPRPLLFRPTTETNWLGPFPEAITLSPHHQGRYTISIPWRPLHSESIFNLVDRICWSVHGNSCTLKHFFSLSSLSCTHARAHSP